MTAAYLEKKRKSRKGAERKESPIEGNSGESSSQNVNEPLCPESAIQLAFIAIVDGNVIDATFGVNTVGGNKRSKDTSSWAFNASRSAKNVLRDAAESSDSVAKLTVETFKRCFDIVLNYHDCNDDLGLITWCYKHHNLQKDAMDDLEEAFLPLSEAVEAATA